MRQQFLHELTTALPVHPVTLPIALRAGQIDGESAAKGVRIALSVTFRPSPEPPRTDALW
jgi:hypothetical protein